MPPSTTSTYPVLTEMGLDSPLLIDDYYITSLNQVDVLRVVFVKRKDSFFTSNRTYRFPRVVAPGSDEDALNTHPKLRAAQAELDRLLQSKSTKHNLAERIVNELDLLEEDIAMRTECLKALAAKIPEVD